MKKAILILAALAVVSCGEEKKGEQINLGEYSSTDTVSDLTAANGNNTGNTAGEENNSEVVEVEITGNDQMQFNKKEITVQAGQTVKLTLTHVGQLAENIMGHNFVLLKEGTDVTAFAQSAAAASDNEYIPEGTDDVIAHTELIGGGESVTIEFEAPGPGTYTFICSFPGHYVMMQGEFIVE